MKNKITLLSALLFFATISFSCKNVTQVQPVVKTDISEFLGQWTLDIKGGSVGWLEVRQEDNYLDADLLWGGGSVTPVANVFLVDRYLIVGMNRDIVRKQDENNNPTRVHRFMEWLEITKSAGDTITGYRINPHGNGIGADTTWFRGIKFPPVPAAPDLKNLKFGEPIVLFNGKDLSGWRLINEKQKNGFKVIEGVLENDPVQVEGQPHVSYGNLRTEQEFNDFNLKLEVNIPAGSNSGIYLKGMYEIQVLDSYKKPLNPHNMGALYSRITPLVAAEKPAGEWQTLDITLCDRHVNVILNSVTIIDNQPALGPTGGAIIWDVFAPGPLYLQGDHGKVSYRNILLTPIIK